MTCEYLEVNRQTALQKAEKGGKPEAAAWAGERARPVPSSNPGGAVRCSLTARRGRAPALAGQSHRHYAWARGRETLRVTSIRSAGTWRSLMLAAVAALP